MKKFLCFLICFIFCEIAFANETIKVVSSFTILGDIIKEIGEDKVEIVNIIGVNQSPHSYQISPKDFRILKNADIIFVHGFDFESNTFMKAVKSANRPYTVASKGIKPLAFNEAGHSHEHDSHEHDSHEHKHAIDPHIWHNPILMIAYGQNITNSLIKIDKKNEKFYKKNFQVLKTRLVNLDKEITKKINTIPLNKRKILISHEAFAYLGERYNIEFINLLGLSDDQELSAKTIAKIIKTVKNQKIRAIFVENIKNPKLINQISKETGVRISGKLFSDALSTKNEEASDYFKLMRYNIQSIVKSLN